MTMTSPNKLQKNISATPSLVLSLLLLLLFLLLFVENDRADGNPAQTDTVLGSNTVVACQVTFSG